MKKIIALAIVALIGLNSLPAAEKGWTTDYPQALKKAETEKKHVLLDFTGSDWCPPCKALHKNVLTSKEFTAFAQKSLILVELDFPSKKKLPDELKAANRKLAEQYKIEGYPTIVMLNSAGKEIWRKVGYGGEKAEDYVKILADAVEKKS